MEGILKSINWESLGISEVLTADDGKKGLELAKKHAPDIVLTDMYMPKMDGAVMAKSIRNFLPDCAFIFISGYSDISYYKSAIQVSAMEFINKPIIIDELVRVLEKSVNYVKDNTTKKHCYFNYKSNELALYIINENADNKKLIDMWINYGMPYSDNYFYHTMLLKLGNTGNDFVEISKLARVLGISVAIGCTETGLVIHAAIPAKNNYFLNTFSRGILNKYNNELDYLTVGKPVRNPVELRDSYLDAANLIKLRFFYPERHFFTFEEKTSSLVGEFDPVNEIAQLLYCNPPSKAKEWVEYQFERIRSNPGTPVEMIKYWGYRMCTELYFLLSRLKEVNVKKHAIHANETKLWKEVSSLKNLDSLKNFVLEIISMFECSQADEKHSPIVWKVQRYIYNNLSKPLSLEELAKHVNLSVTYLCSLFKDETGQTINNYILDVRIRRAKLLLEATDMHINEIAAASGFSSSNYFIKSFKKITGATPQDYRNKHRVM